MQFTNHDDDGVAHNIDFHAVIGPGGMRYQLGISLVNKISNFRWISIIICRERGNQNSLFPPALSRYQY